MKQYTRVALKITDSEMNILHLKRKRRTKYNTALIMIV